MDVFEQEPAPAVDIKKEGLKAGLINGGIALAIMYISYALGINTFIDVTMVEKVLPYMIIVLIIAGLQLRKKNGNYLSMKQGIQFAFLSYVVAAVLVAVGTYILYNVVDPNLGQITFEKGLKRTTELMEKIGAPKKDIDKSIADARKDGAETDFKHIFLGMGLGLIWDFMKSLLVALIIRKEKPAF
jgi:hypothetical protein